eukprot:359550-Chlamydomonas_euryale.AAC.7
MSDSQGQHSDDGPGTARSWAQGQRSRVGKTRPGDQARQQTKGGGRQTGSQHVLTVVSFKLCDGCRLDLTLRGWTLCGVHNCRACVGCAHGFTNWARMGPAHKQAGHARAHAARMSACAARMVACGPPGGAWGRLRTHAGRMGPAWGPHGVAWGRLRAHAGRMGAAWLHAGRMGAHGAA